MGLFGKSPERNPKEMVNEWTHNLRKEGYNLERQIRSIQREEEKIKRSLKEAAAKNDKQVCTILAKEIVRSRKAISKIYTSKAHLNSVQMQMKNQLGRQAKKARPTENQAVQDSTLRVAGSLQKSTEVMQAMQALVRLPEIAQTMQDMSKEMMKAGIIEEMLDETMSSVEDEEEMEEAAQKEVDKVLWELTQGKLGEAPAPPTAVGTPSTSKEADPVPEQDENELDEMQSRLQALRS